MKNPMLSHNLFRILLVVTLAAIMTLSGLSPARASGPGYSVVTWGMNNGGSTALPAGLSDVIAVSAGFAHNLALKTDGTVVGWGANYYGQIDIPSGLADVIAISAGHDFGLALKRDGTVVAWGLNYWNQTNVPAGLTDVVAISAGGVHSLALKADGTVVGWGDNHYGQTSVPANLSGVVAIAAGYLHSLALKSDGTVVGWGYTCDGQLAVPAGLADVVAISAGTNHNLVLKSDGTVVVWGNNNVGQLNAPSGLTGVTAIAAIEFRNLVLKSDGTLVAWGSNVQGESTVPAGLSGVVAIAAGPYHSLALVPQSNTAPAANPGGPYLGAVNTSIQFDGSLSSDPENDLLTYAWTFGDGSATGTGASPTHSYTAAGIYEVCLTVSDGSLNSTPACTMAVVYDPSAGFVTGGGWIDSPAGAFKADESLAGKATFGFMSKYQKGASLPTGNTAFQFDLAGLAFASQSYEWLVVNQDGTNAQFKGSGMLNGLLDPNGDAYKFMLWATDGADTNSADTFRIKIWWEGAGGESVVYDNGVAQAIGAGNIVVHTSK